MPDRKVENPLILIIEDNPSDLRLLSSLIEDQGNVIFATSGEGGIKQAMTRAPDLILLDVELPDMNGYEVCKDIKAKIETRDIPVIFVTGHATPSHEVSALEAGAIDFISKPFNPPIICARVKTHLTLKRQTDLLHGLAERDGLTSVYNRRYFDARAEGEWKRHLRQNQPISIAMMDVDLFKQFNDFYGHTGGDQCLKSIAKNLTACTRRPGEFVARYGGEEFVCLLPYADIHEAMNFGNYACKSVLDLNIPHLKSPKNQKVTLSVGVSSVLPSQKTSIYDLINSADSALYKAKKSGRNCCQSATIL